MRESQLFFFTSVNEDTSTVVLETISNNLPVLCFDACGFGAVVDENIGIKIPLTNPEHSVKDFAEKINYLFNNREVLKQMSENCSIRQQELSWDRKAVQMIELYEMAIEDFKQKHTK
jgi:glycosyltransferase involved in cell wall biosynthesis